MNIRYVSKRNVNIEILKKKTKKKITKFKVQPNNNPEKSEYLRIFLF